MEVLKLLEVANISHTEEVEEYIKLYFQNGIVKEILRVIEKFKKELPDHCYNTLSAYDYNKPAISNSGGYSDPVGDTATKLAHYKNCLGYYIDLLEQVEQVLEALQLNNKLEYELLRLKTTNTTISAEVERIAQATDNSKYRVKQKYSNMKNKELATVQNVKKLLDDYIKKIS